MTTSPTPCRCGPEGCADSSCPGRTSVSEAERLAQWLEDNYSQCHDEDDHEMEAAAELRRLAAVERELETEGMRLAACSVIANANTPESAVSARQMAPKYWSASAADVAAAVDREMALRADRDRLAAEVEALRADAERYRWLRATENANRDEWNLFGPFSSPQEIDAAIDAAKASAA